MSAFGQERSFRNDKDKCPVQAISRQSPMCRIPHVRRVVEARVAYMMTKFSLPMVARMSFDIMALPHGSPIRETEIREAEKSLGQTVPAELISVYRIANGFLGPTNAAFLYPLLSPQSFNDQTAVAFTLELRADEFQPSFWDRAIVFGDAGMMPCWGIEVDSGRIFEWWPEHGDEITYLDTSMVQLWAQKKAWYDEIMSQATNPRG